jgi:MFS family permease
MSDFIMFILIGSHIFQFVTETNKKPAPKKVDVKQTIFIGLGFMSAMIAWSFYNFKIPIILNGIQSDTGDWVRIGVLGTAPIMEIVGGVLMVLDNVIAVLLQPLFGSMSDRLESKFGRRTPFFIIGVPTAVVALVLLPFLPSIFLFIGVILVFNLAMSFYRPPIMSLMPDKTPADRRSTANAFISLMGGIGTIVGVLVAKMVEMIPGTDPVITGDFATQDFHLQDFWGFALTGALMIGCLVLFLLKVRETPTGTGFFRLGKEPIVIDIITQQRVPASSFGEKKEDVRVSTTFKEIWRDPDRSTFWILITLFCYLFGFNALEYSFGRFAVSYFSISEGTAGLLFAIIPGTLILSAVWVGRLGEQIGRLKTMKIGMLVVIGCVLIILIFIPLAKSGTFGSGLIGLWPIILFLGIAGVGWGMINIQCLPVVWQLAPKTKIGVYTGVYYMFSALAAILSPPIMGSIFALIRTLGGNQWDALFPFFLVCVIGAFLSIQRVKRGDATPLTKEELVQLRNQFSGDD